MIVIERNTDKEFAGIRAIAKEVWPIAYGAILSKAQLDYMMEMMYSVASLQKQAEADKHFILAKEDENVVGFASYELNYGETHKTKIHKLYILTTQQGKGIGKVFVDYITNEARQHQEQGLLLNVNKNNIALHFYQKLGFTISFEEVIDIGNGYVMDDYVMEKSISLPA